MCFLNSVLSAQEFDEQALQEAYSQLFHLEYNKVDEHIERLSQTPTGEILALHLSNYKDFLQIFSTDNLELYDQLRPNREKRLKALDNLDHHSPYHRFVHAEILLQWATIDARFKKYLSAYRSATTSYSILEENLEEYPDFLLSRKSLAVCHALVGAIPEKYRWGFRLISRMEGTIDQGLEEIDQVIAWAEVHHSPYLEEATVAKTYILLHLANQPEAAINCLRKTSLDPVHSPIACFIHSNVFLKIGDSKGALKILNDYLDQNGSFELPYLYFLRGLSRIQHLDTGSRDDFETYIRNNKGTNYIKEAYQKLAWTHLIEENLEAYQATMATLLTVGETEVGGDQNAQKEAKNGFPPNIDLLKARLLFDGGLCQRAATYLEKWGVQNFDEVEQQVELIYRKGRVAQCNEDQVSAIIYFLQCIQLGRNVSSYFPCNAALQLGLIFEEMEDVKSAKQHYEQCLSIHPDDYAKALHAKATAGLKRLENNQN